MSHAPAAPLPAAPYMPHTRYQKAFANPALEFSVGGQVDNGKQAAGALPLEIA